MREFVGEERALMTNARCLTEGVDVPAIDCVLFADPKQSVVDIVQAAGRALRPYPGKQCGYILLLLVVPNGIEIGPFADTTAFKQVARTITALSTQDERIAEQFRIVEYGRKSKGKIVEIEGDVPVGTRLDITAFAEQISLKIWGKVGRANWRPFQDARTHVRALGLPSEMAWREYRSSGRKPPDIPSNPNTVYREHGWAGMGDWLGTGTIAPRLRSFRPFSEARAFARQLKLGSQKDWQAFCASGRLPSDIPSNPGKTYANKGWKGTRDWLSADDAQSVMVAPPPVVPNLAQPSSGGE